MQPPTGGETASASLRLMCHLRAARYRPFVRFGDDVAARDLRAGPEEAPNGSDRPQQ
ncbi:hypothetical protein [Streptomyces sp. XD-27]|uniref:hypothetical protein n=1 Tax=Streptomyces sp. XD-27 TaxID=3062779 RepID=UPI0026F40B23|nr:hypothetical protein [Streptomyces sp. XD-27]WKX69377.1 hypothetical protein Q3Y56_05095 [Streptomyces sp. XD-27]